MPPSQRPSSLYQTIAAHYRSAIQAGSLRHGDRMPSLRDLAVRHGVSLSTAVQACRHLEDERWLEARPRSGYFVRKPDPAPRLAPVNDPPMTEALDPAQYVGINAKVSEFLALGRLQRFKTNLSVARCAPALYPGRALQQLSLRSLRLQPDQWARACAPKGHSGFRHVVAKLALKSGMRLSPDDVQITQGCTEALMLALRAVAQPGDTVAVESPTFYGLLQILETLGLKALEIPTSPATGISVDAVELALRTDSHIKAILVVPFLQNPCGALMPDANKQRLLELAQTNDIALIEDDCYSALVNDQLPDGTSMRAIKSWDSNGHVIHCASFGKSLAPGMRLGWITGGKWQQRLEMLKFASSRNNEDLSQVAAAAFLASPAYERHLQQLRSKLNTQRAETAQAIAQCFPEGTRMTIPHGGLSLWVELPEGISATQLFHVALAEHLLISPGAMFSNSDRFDAKLRINCGWPMTPELRKAFETLGRLATSLVHSPKGST